jgi:hypothetical protein
MNIQSLQEGLAQFNRETATKTQEIGDTITDLRSKMSEGLTIPAVIGASSKGISSSGKYVSKVGRGLQSTADKIDNLRGSDGIDMRLPTQIRTPNRMPNNTNDIFNQDTEMSHFTKQPANYTELEMSERPTLQQKAQGILDKPTETPTETQPDTKASSRLRRGAVEDLSAETEPLETEAGKVAGGISKVARGIGEGLEAVGETGIPVISEVADVGAGVLGVYDLIKSIGQGKKIKEEEAQKKQVEESSPQEQVITGGQNTQQPFTIGRGNLNF